MQFCNNCKFLLYRKNFLTIFLHIIWVCKHSDFKFECEWKILKIKSECLQNQAICTTNFGQFFLQGKNWQWLQNRNVHLCQHIFAVARLNHPFVEQLSLAYPRDRSSLSQTYLGHISGITQTYLRDILAIFQTCL